MNLFLEKQIRECLGVPAADLPPGMSGLLATISQSYDRFEHTIEIINRQNTALNNSLAQRAEEISRRETHLALSQNIAHTGSWEMELVNLEYIHENIIYCSDEAYRILGLVPGEQEVTGVLFLNRVHPEDKAGINDAVIATVKTGKTYDIEHRLVLPDGTLKIVHGRAEVSFDRSGRPVKMTGTLQDITAEKKAREQLEKTNHELQTLFGNMQEGFFSVDEETGQMLQISKACEKIWGYGAEDFFKNPRLWFDVVLDEDKEIISRNLPVMRAGKPFSQVYRIRHKDGSTRWLESKITPTLDKEGKLTRIDGMTSDITAKKEAEKKIADNELINRIFFEQDLAGVYRSTTAGKIISCNAAFATMLGYTSPEELLQADAVSLYFAGEERDTLMDDLRARQKLRNYNFELKCKDGGRLYVMENSSLFTDPATGEQFCDGIIINITEQKKAEAEFYNSEKRYRQIVETAQEGIWTIDEHEKTNFVNKKICEILEYSAEEMMGRGLYDFMDDEGKEYAYACMERRKRGSKERLDIRYITKTGKQVWANISANPIFDDKGLYKGALAMVTDITERKRQEEMLIKSEANLRTIFDHTPTFYVLFDAALKIASYNTVATIFMREHNMQPLEEGRHVLDYFPPERHNFLRDAIARAMDGETIGYETDIKKTDGTVKWYDVKWMGVITGEDERKWGLILSSTDITDKKVAALERERITADLIQRNKDLQQFNYIVSHNLRAPVANILGLISLLDGEHKDDPINPDMLKALLVSVKNVDDIIKDLNYILQIKEQGEHEKKEKVYLPQLVDDIKMSISNIIAKEKVQLHCHFEDAAHVVCLRSYLYSIFYNLILNSIKYRQLATVPVINITSLKRGHNIELVFEDNGKGIDLGRYGKDVFRLYKRFDTMVEGKGLGLFMVKSQVESLGGKIKVESKVNVGTTFRLELPV